MRTSRRALGSRACARASPTTRRSTSRRAARRFASPTARRCSIPAPWRPGVTLQNATYWVVSADVGLKFRGLFIQAEYSARWLYDFVGDGPVPVGELFDQSFYLQIAAYPIKHWWELYNATSFVFGDPKAGFHTNWEAIAGTNVYPGAHAQLPAERALHLREPVCRRWNVRLLRRRRTGADYLGGREHLLLRWWQWRLRVRRRSCASPCCCWGPYPPARSTKTCRCSTTRTFT